MLPYWWITNKDRLHGCWFCVQRSRLHAPATSREWRHRQQQHRVTSSSSPVPRDFTSHARAQVVLGLAAEQWHVVVVQGVCLSGGVCREGRRLARSPARPLGQGPGARRPRHAAAGAAAVRRPAGRDDHRAWRVCSSVDALDFPPATSTSAPSSPPSYRHFHQVRPV